MSEPPVRPVDSSGLLLIRFGGDGPEVLLGRRRASSRFLPGAYVVPGGRVDAADRHASGFLETLIRPGGGLDGKTLHRLAVFARTALRECFEETGLLLCQAGTAGLPMAQPAPPQAAPRAAPQVSVWSAYGEAGSRPAFGALLPVARAITPRGYPQRFHTRFFMTLCRSDAGGLGGDGELEDIAWVPLAATDRLPIPDANLLALQEAALRLAARRPGAGPWPGRAATLPAPCFTWRGAGEHLHRRTAGA